MQNQPEIPLPLTDSRVLGEYIYMTTYKYHYVDIEVTNFQLC